MPSTEQDQVNQAITQCLCSYLSEENQQQIRTLFGEDIASNVKTIYDGALNCPVDWRTATMDEGLQSLADFLSAGYPWLTREARLVLTHCFIMAWK